VGGRLYFEVNFDLALSPAHYGLWNRELVDETFKGWKMVRCALEPNPAHFQSNFWAVYEKI